MSAPRVAVLGARRAAQGLGPFVTRALVRAGAEVPCFLGTSEETVAEAREQLRELAGVEAEGFVDAAAMLAAHSVDALAVLTPPAAHLDGLELALERGLPVLCEKPLCWRGEGDADAAEHITTAFDAAGLLFVENAQWPHTLPSYRALHPGRSEGVPARFEMLMAPASHGEGMLVDALSHPLSLLQALAPDPAATATDVRFGGPAAAGREGAGAAPECAPGHPLADADLRVHFVYRAGEHAIDATVGFVHTPDQPRRGGYALDGAWAHRFIRTADYALFFGAGARLVDVPDPLETLVSDFVDRLRGRIIGLPVPLPVLSRRMRLLHELVVAWRSGVNGQGAER